MPSPVEYVSHGGIVPIAPKQPISDAGCDPSFATRSSDRRVVGSAALVAALSVAVKSATAVRELLVAWYFGLSGPLDAYLIAYAVPFFLVTLLAGSLPQVLVPAYVNLRSRGPAWSGENLVASVALVSTITLALLSMAVALGAPLYLPLVGRGFTPEKLALARTLTLFLAPTILSSVLISLAGAVLNAHQRFMVPALSPALSTLIVILALAALTSSLGIYALAGGVLVGTTVELALVGWFAFTAAEPRFGRKLWTPEVQDLTARFGATLVGAALMAGTVLVDQAMSSVLAPGSVAALNYAVRLVTVPLALTAAALGTVVLPHFSLIVAQERWTEASRTLRRYLLGAAGITTPIAILLALFATPLTDFLLARGAFTAQDALTVGPTVAASALQIPFYTCVIILMRLALALRLNLAIAVISAVNLALNVALNAWLASFFGVAGIALSTSLVYVCSFAMLLLVTQQQLRARQLAQS